VTNTKKYKLTDRPKWWLTHLMKWVAVVTALLATVMWLGSFVLQALDIIALNGSREEEDSVAINLSYMADEIMWGAIGILFYASVFWMLSLAVDKIDQLVWLNASDEDREEILAKRKKKNAKNK